MKYNIIVVKNGGLMHICIFFCLVNNITFHFFSTLMNKKKSNFIIKIVVPQKSCSKRSELIIVVLCEEVTMGKEQQIINLISLWTIKTVQTQLYGIMYNLM